MKIPFNSRVRRGLTVAIAFILTMAYVGLAASFFAASWLGGHADVKSLKWASRLDPGSAEYRNHLGRYYDLVTRDPLTAVNYYRSAVQLNPHSARYWFDLSNVYQVLGDTGNQTSSLEHAIDADSMTPDVAWEAGNLYLVQGENEKALHEFRVVIANDQSLTESAIQFCWRINPDVDVMLRDVVPARPEAYAAFLVLLETKGDADGAIKVWNALMQTHETFERRFADGYVRFLIDQKQVDEAVLAWKQIANRFGLMAYLPSEENLIVNGDFNFDVLDAGFDWQYQKQPSVQLMLDPTDSHGGRRSLEITFDGPGISEAGFYQLIAVQPSTTYDFTGYYKNSEMEGAGGPHFTIQDMYAQTVYYESDELKNSGFWKAAYGEFTTSPNCKLVVLHIRRLPGGSPMRGRLWVDDFHLSRKPA
jgi:tetratricopeptide (TPR) repeat protein